MFRTLYARLLAIFIAILLVAMSFLLVVLYQRIRNDKIETKLEVLKSHAEEVAYFAGEMLNPLETSAAKNLRWKCEQIIYEFDAYVMIINQDNTILPFGDAGIEYSYEFTIEDLSALLGYVSQGNGKNVILPTVMSTGTHVFTVGVPFWNTAGEVQGAVFIHITDQSIAASYEGILAESMRAIVFAMGIGAVLILIVTRLITRPLRQMTRAADRFAHGDFEVRVPVESRDEIGRLAEAFNQMAKDLDRLEQTRRGFVANVSHELRSPLTSIQGFINGILDGTVPDVEREHYLGIVLDETRRLNKLISTLLDLSHMDSGQASITRQRFDINEMIVRVLFRQESRITQKQMEVDIDFHEEAYYVNADPDRMEQVMINLIDNAIKYGKEGGRIRLETHAAGGQVKVTVADDGQGIPAEDLPQVFERFYKVDKAHTSGEGTGLGLSIVKSIMDQHGQTITVHSAPGEGTAFTLTLEEA